MTAPPADALAARTRGLRANALAATVMLLVQFSLGAWVALYAALPAADRGKSLFGAFGAAVGDGPIALSLHAILGTLLLVTATAAVVRSARLGSRSALALATIGLAAILVAWIAGSRYVGDFAAGTSLTMAIGTAVALLCYVLVIFLTSAREARADAREPRQPPAEPAG